MRRIIGRVSITFSTLVVVIVYIIIVVVLVVVVMKRLIQGLLLAAAFGLSKARLADRSRVVKARQQTRDLNGKAIHGPAYRVGNALQSDELQERAKQQQRKTTLQQKQKAPWKLNVPQDQTQHHDDSPLDPTRKLSSQLTGCCYNYQSYSASDLCYTYGQDCESGETPSHDSGDGDCSHDGLSFIGLSFSVNTANGNPYSYQLCDQFPMENIIDRKYEYIMSMDEDGWLVGGGYKTFDYSGKMP